MNNLSWADYVSWIVSHIDEMEQIVALGKQIAADFPGTQPGALDAEQTALVAQAVEVHGQAFADRLKALLPYLKLILDLLANLPK